MPAKLKTRINTISVSDNRCPTCQRKYFIKENQEYCFHCEVVAKEDQRISDEMSLLIKNREVEELLSAFREKSLMNADLEQATFENYHPQNPNQQEALQNVREYAEKFHKRKRLLLQGSPGIGKSHLAASIVKEVIKQKFTGIFISVPRLMTELKATYNKNSAVTETELLGAIQKVDLLVMDDLGVDRDGLSDKAAVWAKGKVYEIIDSRVGKATVYTTNFTGKQLLDMYGERDFSRMVQDCKPIKLEGKNYRLKDFM